MVRPARPPARRSPARSTPIKGLRKMEFRWQDTYGLEGKEPFTLSINGRVDEAPSLTCEDLPRQKVVLDSEMLSFKIRAQDDFGIRRVGMEWRGRGDAGHQDPGQRRTQSWPPAGTTRSRSRSPARSRPSRSVSSRSRSSSAMFVEDYFPGRGRVYHRTYTFYVLNAEQHAIWLTEQLSKWHRQSLEVRDQELQLYETNKQLRSLPAKELDRPETRRRIENQASAERQTGGGSAGLVVSAKTWSARRCATPSSASAISRSGPRCSRSSRTSPPTGCRRSPTCSSRPPRRREVAAKGRRRAARRRWPARSGPPGPVSPRKRPRCEEGPAGHSPRSWTGIVAAAARQERRREAGPQQAPTSRRLTCP